MQWREARRISTHMAEYTHTHAQIKVIWVLCHITKPCVPPAFTNKGQNTATCLSLIGHEGRAHHSCGTTCLLLPCLFECFGEISSVHRPEHAAWNLTETNTRADGQTSETDTEGQTQTSYVCHGASPLAPCLLQTEAQWFPSVPFATKRCIFYSPLTNTWSRTEEQRDVYRRGDGE